MANDFSIGDALSFGWNVMKKNFLLFLYIMLTFIGLEVISNLSARARLGFIVVAAVLVIIMILKLGAIRIALDILDNRKVSYKQLISQPSLFPDYLIGTVLYLLIIVGGLILLVVPGIIWALKFQFYDYYIVDKKLGPIEALKRSAKATYGYKWDLFLFWLAIIGINIVGALALLVGLFATIPTSEMAFAWTYRKLDAKYETQAKALARAEKGEAKATPARKPTKKRR
jgi:uncharacterized membrane protein